MKKRRGFSTQVVVIVVVLMAIAAAVAWKLWFTDEEPETPTTNPAPATPDKSDKPTTSDGSGDGSPPPTPTDVPASKTQALADYTEGLALWRQEKQNQRGEHIIQARTKLSNAFFSGQLDEAKAEALVPIMTHIAEETLLRGNFYDGDPYVYRYVLQPGQVLTKLERAEKLHIPTQLIEKINHTPAKKMRAGKGLMLIRGPFHAIVRKRKFVMDIYLQREDLPKVFVKRFRVGLGSSGQDTPVGSFRVEKGKKLKAATWNPPANSVIQRRIKHGEPGYPLGKEGYWISLEGTDPRTRNVSGIGIHGTNDPNSIGKAQSLGCIRMADADIEWVFSLLYEHWSTVQIVP